MDGIHDMGGMQGFGRIQAPKTESPFAAPWEGNAFALALVASRAAGGNVHAFRHAVERVPPAEYLTSYYGRWLLGAQNLLADSGVVSAEQVAARATRMSGHDVAEPPPPTRHKPRMPSGGPGNLRDVDAPPAFAVGDVVHVRDLHPVGHTRMPRYVRRRTGTVTAIRPAQVLPDSAAHFDGEDPQHVYSVEFSSRELWGADSEPFTLSIDLFEPYLEAAT